LVAISSDRLNSCFLEEMGMSNVTAPFSTASSEMATALGKILFSFSPKY